MLRAYKYRIYPTYKQQQLIRKTFGCTRFVYNQCLAHKIAVYQNNKTSLSSFDLMTWSRYELKPEYVWLKEVVDSNYRQYYFRKLEACE